jgi:hypothetical protein
MFPAMTEALKGLDVNPCGASDLSNAHHRWAGLCGGGYRPVAPVHISVLSVMVGPPGGSERADNFPDRGGLIRSRSITISALSVTGKRSFYRSQPMRAAVASRLCKTFN